jgi:predicted metal-dependent enzyme (double-stranded beta helix superfamily)
MTDDRVFGDIGTKVIYEDETVRVWRLTLSPGQESPIHRHGLDHLLVQVSGDRIAVIPEPDTQGPYAEVLEADVVPGAVIHVRRGGVERARNVGTQPYLEVIIELKDPGVE